MPRFNSTANGLASLGRNGDTMLMHVNPQEVAGLSALLGSEPTVNPDTGLPEAFNWGGIISGLFETVLGGAIGDAVYEPIKDFAESTAKDLFGDWGKDAAESIGKGTGILGSALGGGLGGAATGAAGAALSGDNIGYGALGGFGSGAMSGGYYGLERKDALGQAKPQMNPAVQEALNANVGDYTTGVDMSKGVEDSILNRPQGWNAPKPAPFSVLEASSAPAETPSFWSWNDNFKKNLQPLLLAGGVGQSLKAMGTANDIRKEQDKQKLALLKRAGIRPEDIMYSYSFTSPGTRYSGGGAVGYATEFGVPTQVNIPERYIDELKKAGGIAALGMTNPTGHAQGGYINTKPFNPENAYPQSMIERAKPYAAAAPQRHEVVEGYEDGGFVEGDGDGMSDDIPALLEGEEEIRVADGEVIIPKAIVDMFGVEALDNMLKRVRMAAYGTDKQVTQDAGKEVVLDMLD